MMVVKRKVFHVTWTGWAKVTNQRFTALHGADERADGWPYRLE
jgi:hypothetical protein